MSDPTASIWEVTRLILGDPAASPHEIAQAHGYSMADVAEALPLVLDNVHVDYAASGASTAGIDVRPPDPLPGESAADHAARFLLDLRGTGELDVASYDALGARADPGWLDDGAGPVGDDLDDLPAALPADGTGDGGGSAAFGDGGAGTGAGHGPAGDGPGLGDDDPFDGASSSGLDAGTEAGGPDLGEPDVGGLDVPGADVSDPDGPEDPIDFG